MGNIRYVSFDPGKTTGWATWDEKGDILNYGQADMNELIHLCREWENEPLIAVIYESFVIFKHKAAKLAGSSVEASQAIGVIKSLIWHTDAEAIKQDPSIKPIAQKWTQVRPPSNHNQSHWVDAFNHGAYWLINQGIRKSALEKEQGNA